jgi:hypothetical protein
MHLLHSCTFYSAASTRDLGSSCSDAGAWEWEQFQCIRWVLRYSTLCSAVRYTVKYAMQCSTLCSAVRYAVQYAIQCSTPYTTTTQTPCTTRTPLPLTHHRRYIGWDEQHLIHSYTTTHTLIHHHSYTHTPPLIHHRLGRAAPHTLIHHHSYTHTPPLIHSYTTTHTPP